MTGSRSRANLPTMFSLLMGVLCWRATPVTAQDQTGFAYEIISHKATLHIFPGENAIRCVDTLGIRIHARRPDHMRLRLLPVYEVETVTINGRASGFERKGDSIQINKLPPDSVFWCVVKYSGILAFRSEFSLLTRERAVLREEEVLPHGNSALEEVRLSIEVPAGWEALAPGRLVRQQSMKDSALYVFELDKPVPTIGWICAGKYWSRGNDSGGIAVSIHLLEEDSSFSPGILPLAEDVLQFYSRKFSPYRFSDLKIVEVDDWLAGRSVLAVAIPNMVMIKRLTLRTDDRFNQARAILPHEIAHQWWPMTVFIDAADAALLSEGMCDYSALLFNESKGRLSVRDSLKHHPLLRPLILRAEEGRDIPLQGKADLRSLPTHYLKASYIHNMLRHIMGDTVFFRLYREYAARFDGKRIGLDDFQRLAEELSGKKLEWFFQQWVRKRGIPRMKIYNVRSVPAGEQWITRGRVRIVGYDQYTALVDVGAQTSSGIVKTSVWLGKDSLGIYRNDMPFEVVSAAKPVRAVLDPDGDVLKKQKLPVKFSDVRDPSDGLLIVGTLQHADYLLELARKDSAEMTAASWSVTIKPDRAVTLGDLQNARVFLYGKASENSTVAELAPRFPIGFRGDSVEIPRALRDSVGGFRAGRSDSARFRGETIFDSTLALLQCIESPYRARGFLAWIAPMSELARPSLSAYDASWAIVRGKDVIGSGTREVRDDETAVEIK